MTVGDCLDLAVERVVFRGRGLARHAGEVVFVAGVAPGERVRARVTRLHRRFAEADLLEVLEPAPDRITPCCRLPGGALVPGCVYDHLAYPAEVAVKQGQLEEFLRRLPAAVADVVILPPVASPRPLHYRNKIVLHAARLSRDNRLLFGYVGDDNRCVVDLPACPLAREPINVALTAFRTSAAGRRLRHGQDVTFRWTETDGAVWWTDAAPRREPLTETAPFGRVEVPSDGFYQVNPEVGDALVRQVAAWCAGAGAGEPLLDLYCGIGVFALACAKAGTGPVAGVESGRAAVAAARANAAAHGLAATFACRTVAQAAADGFEECDLAHATVIADPPRQGMEPEVTAALAERKPPRLCCVSCDPATLARDLRVLLAAGYRLRRAQLFDMFPRTAPFETAVWLEAGD